ncbi:MAG: hypothetical protein ACRD4Q_10960 [Candidatus Acidiferrales bacterium]
MTAGQLRTFLRELPEETRIDFQFGDFALELLMLGRRLAQGYAELYFAESNRPEGAARNDRPAGEMPAHETTY